MVEVLAPSPSCASIHLLLCAVWAVLWCYSSPPGTIFSLVVADLGCQLETLGKRDPHLKNCFP